MKIFWLFFIVFDCFDCSVQVLHQNARKVSGIFWRQVTLTDTSHLGHFSWRIHCFKIILLFVRGTESRLHDVSRRARAFFHSSYGREDVAHITKLHFETFFRDIYLKNHLKKLAHRNHLSFIASHPPRDKCLPIPSPDMNYVISYFCAFNSLLRELLIHHVYILTTLSRNIQCEIVYWGMVSQSSDNNNVT